MRTLWQHVDTYRLVNAVIGAICVTLAIAVTAWLVASVIVGTAEIVGMVD